MALPLPGSGGDAFVKGLDTGSSMIDRLMQRRQKDEELGMEKEQMPLKLDLLKAQAEGQRALAGQRGQGGQGLGTGGKEELFFQSLVAKDNPQFAGDPQKIYEASNALRMGQSTLADGTPINPLSPASQSSFDRITKGTTTSSQINQMINAKGADAEIDTLSNLATQWNKPYGTTYLNMSPAQIMDTFKNDEASQTRLGEFAAAQQLQNEIAQIETRLAMGQPGITNTHDLMKLGLQQIDARYPMLSQKAREVAQKRFVYALKKGLEARGRVGIGASSALSNSPASGGQSSSSSGKGKTAAEWARETLGPNATPEQIDALVQKLKGQG